MSLRTADFFSRAITRSNAVTSIVGDRIFLPARPTVDENEDTIPYIIIVPAGVTNTGFTKDDTPEGDEDTANVDILCVAESHDRLTDLCEAVREACVNLWRETVGDEHTPVGWQFSTTEEIYEKAKPCNYLILTYQCTTNR